MSRWIIAGTDAGRPYPCRCNERPEWAEDCSAAWCPCAGRRDREGLPASCCSWRYGPADHVRAMEEWRIRKLQNDA